MDRVIVLGCVLLVAFGAIFGIAINLQSGSGTAVKSALEVAAAISTIFAAAVAVHALTVWKSEFRHGKKFDSLARLKAAVDGLGIAPKFMRYSMMHGLHRTRRNATESDFLNDTLKASREEWSAADRECSAAIDECELFVDEAKFRELTLLTTELFGLVMNYKDEMLDLAFQDEKVDEPLIRENFTKVERECISLLEKLRDLVKELRSGFRN
ncbi:MULTISPECIES: hypothetical protein [unclassified Pseudomonas]|uniref:hypothetical protein n=1 Tax=unclassified Pseudomonas TaxID=196821 RepID=UPI000A1DB8A1|nr:MULTISPECIES: hypothetical protein [unclassified Pseudomonas]